MAWKYRQEYHEQGDAIIPDDWLENQNEFVSEINGYLDRDNFRSNGFSRNNGFDSSSNQNAMPLVSANTFNKVYADAYSTTNDPTGNTYGMIKMLDLGGDKESVGWSTKGTGQPTAYAAFDTLPALDLNLSDGGLLIIEFSGHFKWFGVEEENLGLWSGVANPSWGNGAEGHLWDVYCPDDDPDDRTGPRRMFACIKFRVVCDGGIVAESGWFANHVQRNSVYLVGAAPVTAGRPSVEVQYKLAYIDNRVPGESVERFGVMQPVRMFERELIVHHRKR